MTRAETVAGDSRPARRLSLTARIGLAAVMTAVAARILLGSFVVNDWEGWGTFLSFAVTAVVEGLVLGGLVFGLAVRLASRGSNRRRAVAALVLGVLGVLALAIPYSAPQPIIGAAAVALGLPALQRGGSSSP
ncbi:MAG TPA: hypothetical protein VK926_03840, partial [Gaiellaceae bacterium]|nr:hypothetical protein [Gaiellaceae bacterium]